MSEDIQSTATTTKPETHVPHSPEVEDEIIRRLIRDVVVPKPARLNLPKE